MNFFSVSIIRRKYRTAMEEKRIDMRKPVHLKRNSRIGAGTNVLPG